MNVLNSHTTAATHIRPVFDAMSSEPKFTITPVESGHADPFITDRMDTIPWCTSLPPPAIDRHTGGPSPRPMLIAALYQNIINRPLTELPIDLDHFYQEVASLKAQIPSLPKKEREYYAARANGLTQALQAWPQVIASGDSALTFICRRQDAPYERGRVLIAAFNPKEQLDRVFLSGQDAHTSYANQRALAITSVSIHFARLYPWAVSPTFIASPEPVSGSLNAAIRALPEGRDLAPGRTRLCAEYALSRHMLISEAQYTQLTLWIGPAAPSPWDLQRLHPLKVEWSEQNASIIQVVGPCNRCQNYDTVGFYRGPVSYIQQLIKEWKEVRAPQVATQQSMGVTDLSRRAQIYAKILATLQQLEPHSIPVLSPQRKPRAGESQRSPLKGASRHALQTPQAVADSAEQNKENQGTNGLTVAFTTPPLQRKR